MPPQNDITQYLQNTKIPDSDKASVWDLYHGSKSQADFEKGLRGLNVPDSIRADVWDLRSTQGWGPAKGSVWSMYPDLNHLADTITAHEGGPGNINFKNNNPGNLVYAGQPGATKDERGFAVFQNADAGRQALLQQLGKYKNDHPNLTPEEFINGNGDFKGYSSDSAPGNAPGQAQAYADALRKNATPLPPPSAQATGTIGAYHPSVTQRLSDFFAPFTEHLRVGGNAQDPRLLAPEKLMTPDQQQAHPIAAGAADVAGSLTTGGNLAAIAASGGLGEIPGIAGRVIPRLVAGGFGAQMLYGAGQKVPQVAQQVRSGDIPGAERTGTQAALEGLLGVFGLRGAAKGGVKAEARPEAPSEASSPIQKPPIEAPPPLTLQAQPTQIPLPLTEAPVERRVSNTPINFANRRNLPIPEAQKAAFWDEVKGKPKGFSKGANAQAAAASSPAPQESAPVAEPPRVAPPEAPTPQGAVKPLPEWITSQQGGWFSRDQKLANSYGPIQLAVDVPENVANTTDESMPGRSIHILPKEWATKARPSGELSAEPASGQIRLYRGVNDPSHIPAKLEASNEDPSKGYQGPSSVVSPSGIEHNDSASVKAPLSTEAPLLAPRERYEDLRSQLAKNESELQQALKQAALGNVKENAAEKFAPRGARTQKQIDWMKGESDRLRNEMDKAFEEHVRTMPQAEAQKAHDNLREQEGDYNKQADAIDRLVKDDKISTALRIALRSETLSKAQRQGIHNALGDMYDTGANPSISRLRFAKSKQAKVSVQEAHNYIAKELSKVGITQEHIDRFGPDLSDPKKFGRAVKGLETVLPPGTDAATIAKHMQILANKTPVVLNYPRFKGLAKDRIPELDLRTVRQALSGVKGGKGLNLSQLVDFSPEQIEQYNSLKQSDPNAAFQMKKAAIRDTFSLLRDKARARANEVGFRADQVARLHSLDNIANKQAINDLINKRIRLNDKTSDTGEYVLSDRRLQSLANSPRTLGETFQGADTVSRARDRIQAELQRRTDERAAVEAKRMEAIKATVNPAQPEAKPVAALPAAPSLEKTPAASHPLVPKIADLVLNLRERGIEPNEIQKQLQAGFKASGQPQSQKFEFIHNALTEWKNNLDKTSKAIPGFEKRPDALELLNKDKAANDEQAKVLQAEVEKAQHPSNTLFSGASMLSPRVVKAVFPKVSDYFADKGPSVKDIARKIVREQTGVAARAKAQLFDSLKEESKRWVGTSNAGLSQFTDAVESGNLDGLSKEDTKLVGSLREILDSRRDAIRNLGTGKLEKFYENYFPHIWEHPSRARDIVQSVLQGRKPLQGSANFLKQRSISTISAGIAEGLKPVTTNPVELVLLKAHEMDRYLMAHKIFGAYKDAGLLQFVKLGQLRPEGFTKINDTLFRSLIPTKSGMILRGEWHAPDGAAKILNNYLSPGLRGNWAYDIFRGTTNTLNQVQLGFSAFHLGFTTLDSQVSDLALGLEQISRGKVGKGAYTAIRSFMPGLSVANNFAIGKGVIAEYLKPGSAAKYAQTAEMVGKAGGRIAIDPMYVNDSLKKLQEGFGSGNWAQVGKNVIPAAIETTARPIMSTVAKVKLGVFHGLASDLMERAREGGWDEFKIGEEMQKAWDSVDNRMGQMVYDNRMWNRTAKDLGMISIRSLGWNVGTISEVGGGAQDFGTQFLKAATNNRVELTHRMAYLMALPAVVGFYGAMLNYAHTGEPPKELKDYFFPRTGKLTASGDPERLSLPSYMKDIYAWKHSPTQVAIHKLSPAIAMTADLIQNQDFYGNEIRHPEDSRVRQAVDTAKWAMTQATPFNIQGIIQRMKASGASNPFDPKTIAGTVESQVGITPAPAYVNRSTAAEMARGYAQRMESRGPFTKEQSAHIARVRDYETLRRAGKATDEDLYQAIQRGELTDKEADSIGEIEDKQPRFIQDFKRISLPEALRVWDVMSPKEREATRDLLADKETQVVNYLPVDQERMIDQLKRAFFPEDYATPEKPRP